MFAKIKMDDIINALQNISLQSQTDYYQKYYDEFIEIFGGNEEKAENLAKLAADDEKQHDEKSIRDFRTTRNLKPVVLRVIKARDVARERRSRNVKDADDLLNYFGTLSIN
jgi:hypothetical protein